MKKLRLLLMLVICLASAGCAAIPALFSPTFSATTQQEQLQTSTWVNLSGQNYRIVKTNVSGTSKGFSFLGIIPIVTPDHIKALNRLYNDAGLTAGSAQALANVAQHENAPYFILFSLPRVTIRADVIEFTGPAPAALPGGATTPSPTAPPATR